MLKPCQLYKAEGRPACQLEGLLELSVARTARHPHCCKEKQTADRQQRHGVLWQCCKGSTCSPLSLHPLIELLRVLALLELVILGLSAFGEALQHKQASCEGLQHVKLPE